MVTVSARAFGLTAWAKAERANGAAEQSQSAVRWERFTEEPRQFGGGGEPARVLRLVSAPLMITTSHVHEQNKKDEVLLPAP